jgi:hypothetical protein
MTRLQHLRQSEKPIEKTLYVFRIELANSANTMAPAFLSVDFVNSTAPSSKHMTDIRCTQ